MGIYGYDKEVIPYLDSNLRIENGVYIAKILQDGPLYNSAIHEGDIIVKVDSEKINKMNDLKRYIYSKNPGDTIKLIILRDNKEFEAQVKLGYKIS